jgi:hypothetical protein
MKLLICIGCCAILLMQGCKGGRDKNKNSDTGQTSSKNSNSKIPVPVATDNLVVTDEKDLTGYWVGLFGADDTGRDSLAYEEVDEEYNKINVSIDEINGNKVAGHTVIAGKVRFFNCEMEKTASKYKFTFKGGADQKADGRFTFSITKGDSVLSGRWDAGDKIIAHGYDLKKNIFTYNPNLKLTTGQYVDWSKGKKVTIKTDDGDTYQNEAYFTTSEDLIKFNASTELLTKDFVANLKKGDLLVLRNSIFARHGYTFKKPRLNLYFSQQPWYVPLSTDVTAVLTATEKKNIALMMPYEKNAEAFYNAYGR